MDIYIRIKELRINNKLSQEDFADKIGIKRSMLSKIETNKTVPTTETILKIANFFHITTDYLITGKQEEKNTDMNISKNQLKGNNNYISVNEAQTAYNKTNDTKGPDDLLKQINYLEKEIIFLKKEILSKDKELESKQNEIELLKELNAIYKKKNEHH